MIKKSRLRLQKRKKGGRVILSLLGLVVLGVIGHQLEQHYRITTYLSEILHNVKGSFVRKGPVRGTFYDRNLKHLAVTLDRVSVYARTREIKSIEETASQLGKTLGLDQDKLEKQLESGALRLWIARDISQEQEVSIKNLHLAGVYLQKEEKRYYPNEFKAAHFIGYVENGIGLAGVEFYYDRLLAGRIVEKEDERQPLGSSPDLVLTIDLKIQEILEELAKDIAIAEQAEKVTAYLMESDTGEMIGGANLPGFNPNTFRKYSQEQTENMLFSPLCLPAKSRLFLRDATKLYTQNADQVSPSAWSLIPERSGLGSQLRFWDWLGFGELAPPDFYVPDESGKTAASPQQAVAASTTEFSYVPESASPASLLVAYAILLNKGKMIHPFVVKKILDNDSGREIPLTGQNKGAGQPDIWTNDQGERVTSFFRSQARPGAANSYLFRDANLVAVGAGKTRQLFINDLLVVSLPAGSNELIMLVVVQRPPQGVSSEEGAGKRGMEQLVEEKLERISNLQEIAKSVADVVEAEPGDEGNYQGKGRPATEFSKGASAAEKEKPAPGVMPDLKGFSLRKSLRLLKGTGLEFSIQGTGRVIDQRPPPGTSLKGITRCKLILEKQEKIVPKNFSKEPSDQD